MSPATASPNRPGILTTRLAYDYQHQTWIVAGRYQDCGHPASMPCGCFGRQHADEPFTTQQEAA